MASRPIEIELAILGPFPVSSVPNEIINGRRQHSARLTTGLLNLDQGAKVALPKHFIHHRPHAMNIFIANLNENRAALTEQLPCHR